MAAQNKENLIDNAERLANEAKPENLIDRALTWINEDLMTVSTFYQIALLFAVYITSLFIYHRYKDKLLEKIDTLKIPSAVKRIYRNFIKLILPICALSLLFISSQILALPSFGINTDLSNIVMKVLLAWIVIRIAVQFIANNAARNFFAFSIWTIAVLSIIGILDETMITLDSLAFSIGEFRISALAVIKSIILLFALLYSAIFISSFAEQRIFQIKSISRSSQVLIAKVVRVILIVIALLVGITSAGIDLSLFAVFGGAIGLGIGFGLQKGISNLFSGMLLLIDRSIEPGDVIELPNGTFGWVNQMAARYTEIVTRDNKSFLIPNEEFITQRVVNWSHGNSLIRLEVVFGVSYNADPHLVKELAQECVAGAHERICIDPGPVCHLAEFGDSSLNFKLRFWIKDAEQGVTNIRSEVMFAIWDMLKANNIEIPYPHREVFVHQLPPQN